MKTFQELRIEMLENSEQIDELSKKTLGSYVKKASDDMYDKGGRVAYHSNKGNKSDGVFADASKKKHRAKATDAERKAANRSTGISRAVKRLSKEDTEVNELSKKTLGSYINKAAHDKAANASELGSGKIDWKRDLKRTRGIKKAVKRLSKEDTEVNELSSNTLGRYAKKAHRVADIGKSSGADAKSDKRVAGAKLAVKKLGAKAGAKGDATRTANNIQKSTDKAKAWRKDKSVDRNKEYSAAQKGINRLWDKAANRRG